MPIVNALAGIMVSDLATAAAWYEQLLSRPEKKPKRMPERNPCDAGYQSSGAAFVEPENSRGGHPSLRPGIVAGPDRVVGHFGILLVVKQPNLRYCLVLNVRSWQAGIESGSHNRRQRQSSETLNANGWCYAYSFDRHRVGVVARRWRRLLRARGWLGDTTLWRWIAWARPVDSIDPLAHRQSRGRRTYPVELTCVRLYADDPRANGNRAQSSRGNHVRHSIRQGCAPQKLRPVRRFECPADVLSGTGAAKTAAEGYWDHAAPPPFMARHVDVESDCHATAVIAFSGTRYCTIGGVANRSKVRTSLQVTRRWLSGQMGWNSLWAQAPAA